MGNIVGEKIPNYTASQINRRQEIHGKTSGRTPQELTVLNSNTSWVKLASGVSVDKNKLKELDLNEDLSGMTLARENILFGGTSSKPVQTSPSTSPVSSPKKYPKSPVAGYEHTKDFGIVPMPGIESISIKNLNRGSIKKAKIKIKVHSRSQFEIIDTLYLRLGYTALLEWGNANYISSKDGEFKTVQNTLVEDPTRFFNIDFEKDRSWRDILPAIEGYRARYNGNYDGFLGKVSNFSWDFNPDGSYDIDLEMISMGDIIESLKSNVSISPKFKTFIENYAAEREEEEDDEDFITPYDNSNLITSLLFLWKYRNKEATGPNPSASVTVTPGNGVKGYVGRKLYPETVVGGGGIFEYYIKFKETTQVLSTVGSVSAGNFDIIETDSVNTIIGTLDGENTTKRYPPQLAEGIEIDETVYELRKSQTSTITEKELVKEEILDIVDFISPINIPSTPVIRLNTKPDPAHYIRFKYLLQFIKNRIIPSIKSPGGVNTPLFRIDDTIGVGDIEVGNYMFTLPNQVSLDPRVCIVRNDSVYKVRTPDTPAKFLPELPPFRLVDDKPSTPHQNHAYLMNVYLNFDFVASSLDSNTDDRGDVGLFGLINSLCEGINKAMGGINNLEPVIDESTNILKIIDSSLSKSKKRGAYGLEVVGYNPSFNSSTFLRNINLKTAITPEYATMMTIGATAGGYVKGVEATAFSNWNKGLIDRFKTEVTLTDNTSTSTPSTGSSDGDEAEQNYIDYLEQYVSCYGITPTKGWKNGRVYFKFVDDVIGNNISIVTEYYKFLQNKNGKGNTIGFIPFKFSFDMDGLSGFKIYNQLHVSTRFLPRNYGNTLDFIVTGVTNNVKSNDWTTSIETMVVPVTRDTNGVEENITELSEAILNYRSPAGGSGGSQSPVADEKTLTSGYPMRSSQYSKRKTKKSQIYLHHDAFYQRSDKSKGCASILFNRGVSCHAMIDIDGHVERMFDDAYISYCQGLVRPSVPGKIWPNSTGLSIELAGLGFERKGVDFTIGEPLVQCVDWNGNPITKYKHKRYQEYSDAQIKALYKLLKHWLSKHDIPFVWEGEKTYKLMFPPQGTNSPEVAKGKPGIWTHNSVDSNKSDVFPSPKLIKMFKELSNEIN